MRNGEIFLGAAIASVLSQSHEDLRLFVVDDNSTDGSLAIATDVCARDSRVTVLRNDGAGIVAALETGIAAGGAPLIARMDADDLSLPRRLELQSTFLAHHPDVALVGGAVDVIDSGGRIFRRMTYPTVPAEIDRRILTEVCFASATMVLRRSAFEEIGGFRALFEPAEDVDLALRIAERHAVANLSEVVLCYRVHANNVSVSRLKQQMQAVMIARAESTWRRRHDAPPSLQSLDELRDALGVAQKSIDQQSLDAALAWSELLAEADLPEKGEALLQEAATLRAKSGARTSRGHKRMVTRKVVPACYFVGKSISVLVREGPRAFVHKAKSWSTARLLEKPTVLIVDTSPGDTLKATMPQHGGGEPDASIIIVVWNALSYAADCFRSVINAASEHSFEVIVVDNGSEPDVLAWLEQQAEVHSKLGYVCLPSNVGFARGSNIGVRMSSGRYVVLLNSDTLVTDGWLDKLLGALEQNEDLGLVSPVTNYVGEGDQIDEAARDIQPEAIPEYAQSIVGRTEVIRVPERVAFFCVAMARHLFERLNGIDEGFGFGNFEDEDFCLRLQMLGYGVGVVTNAFVFHHGSRTFESNYVDHSQWMVQNLDRYVEKMDRSCTRFPSTRRRNGTIEQPVVSVIVRTRNRPADLRLALNSLMWQTSCQFEVVVVNDGGEDVEELLGLYANDMQIRYVNNQPGHGRSGAANDGAEAATGRFMTFLDDDDIVYPFHLASLVREAERVDAATPFVYSQYNRALVRGRGESASIIDRIHVPFWKFDRNDLLIGNQPPLHTWLLPRTLYESHGGFDPSFGILHDWDFLLRVTNETPLVGLPRATCQYRIYLDLNNSVSGGRRQALEELRNVYERHPAGSQKIKLRRRLEVAGLESQVALAEELNASVEHGGMTREEAARRYVASVFGFGVHGY